MLEMLAKLSPSAIVGFLFGLLLAWWVQPTTTGGTFLIVTVSVFLSVILVFFSKYLYERSSIRRKPTHRSEDKSKIWLPGDD